MPFTYAFHMRPFFLFPHRLLTFLSPPSVRHFRVKERWMSQLPLLLWILLAVSMQGALSFIYKVVVML